MQIVIDDWQFLLEIFSFHVIKKFLRMKVANFSDLFAEYYLKIDKSCW